MITITQLNAVLTNISREQMRYCALEFRKASSSDQHDQANTWLKLAIFHRAASERGLDGRVIPHEILKVADGIVKQSLEASNTLAP